MELLPEYCSGQCMHWRLWSRMSPAPRLQSAGFLESPPAGRCGDSSWRCRRSKRFPGRSAKSSSRYLPAAGSRAASARWWEGRWYWAGRFADSASSHHCFRFVPGPFHSIAPMLEIFSSYTAPCVASKRPAVKGCRSTRLDHLENQFLRGVGWVLRLKAKLNLLSREEPRVAWI